MNIWMVRAVEGGRLADKFAEGYIAVGWNKFLICLEYPKSDNSTPAFDFIL